MKASDIRALSLDEMKLKLVEFKHELFNLRFQKGAGQLENPCKLKQTKKDIARINTALSDLARNPKKMDSQGANDEN
ncbi:MAG: 50S ribosomal protein L29 [Desulfatitalea sp.]|nr:50S ribosomal protein L29 [Desulfatitalea sp.]NNK00214.1 50S ribosomal protein L29 [Desulfatitalea sp.]